MKCISAILIFGILLSACASTSIKHVSAEKFLKKAQDIEHMNSAHWTTYIGSTQKRAYLEYGDVFGLGSFWGVVTTRTIVYWTELNQLPNEIVTILKQGKSPWIPWEEQNKRTKDNQLIKRTENTGLLP